MTLTITDPFDLAGCPSTMPEANRTHRRRAARTTARHAANYRRRTQILTGSVLAAMVVGSVTVTAAPAEAAPAGATDAAGQGGITAPDSPGGQGGITTPSAPGGQGGITTPAPAPTPAPTTPSAPSIIPAPTYDAPPVYEPAGSSGGSGGTTTPTYTGPSYSTAYNPVPPMFHAPVRTAPVNPILPRPGILKFGNQHFKQPAWLSDADARNLNGQSATIEARVATYYESIGFPKDQAARTAASTTVGILVGGTAGAIAVGIPAAVLGGVVGAGVGTAAGAIIGAFVPSPIPGALAGPGALIGLGSGIGVGAIGGGLGGATLGALGGGLIGGAIGYAVGAGDPGGNPNAPLGPTTENPRLFRPAPPHPEANQYEAHLDGRGLPGGGKVDYVVNKRGDVNATAKLGAASIPLHISAAQADAPFKAAGALAQTARDTVSAAVADISRQAERAIPGLKVAFPQTDAPAPKHAAAPAAPRHAAAAHKARR